jgi:ubiquinone/menaquinone biosynthesis C-methylase UbiE
MKWLNSDPRPHQTALAMIGAKPGQQILVLGARDGGLAAAIAGVTGLNGRTVVIDPSAESEARVDSAAAEAGVLVEFAQESLLRLSSATDLFDVVVLNQTLGEPGVDRAALVNEAARVIRPGGRLIVIEGEAASGIRSLFQRPPQRAFTGTAAKDLLTAAGLRGSRILAETGGVTFVEAAKPRT